MNKTEFNARFNESYRKFLESTDFHANIEKEFAHFSDISQITPADLATICIKVSFQTNQLLLKEILQDLLTDGQ